MNELNKQFAVREEAIEGLVIALIDQEHELLIEPPEIRKSTLVTELAYRINGANYFQCLLIRFSTPEELFDPTSLQTLVRGVYKRNTSGKLPEAHTSFSDEIFKESPS